MLENIEEALKKSKEKSDKDSTESKDDFVTKLSAQIIKNVQVRIENVHIRFEDSFTDPCAPYVSGLIIRCK